MKLEAAVCPSCQHSFPGNFCNTPEPITCPACVNTVLVEIFPAFFNKTVTGQSAETIVEEGISSCFYHEKKKAVVPCDNCGRFLCALCDVALEDRHYCPGCLEAGKKKGKLASLENKRPLYDGAALSLLVTPIFWPFAIVTGPLAMFYAILSWRRPGSLVGRTRWRAYLALVLAPLEIAGWVTVVWSAAAGHQ